MRKFIVSDLHGNGDVYDSIMGYLENVSLDEEVDFYINGDLIDRGLDGFRMIMDVKERVQNPGRIKVHYLGGNREWLMYDALKEREPGKGVNPWCNWMSNGGYIVAYSIEDREDGEELFEEFKHFIGDLKIYHVFDEKIQGKPMVLVHAQTPEAVRTGKEMRIADQTMEVEKAVWTRKHITYSGYFGIAVPLEKPERIGLDGYFSIVGHTPVENREGFALDQEENAINIDGGCAPYACGKFEYDKVPLVEVKNDHIDILLFNHDNEIVKGFHYDGTLKPMASELLESHRSHLNHQYDHQAKVYQKEILEIVNLD